MMSKTSGVAGVVEITDPGMNNKFSMRALCLNQLRHLSINSYLIYIIINKRINCDMSWVWRYHMFTY